MKHIFAKILNFFGNRILKNVNFNVFQKKNQKSFSKKIFHTFLMIFLELSESNFFVKLEIQFEKYLGCRCGDDRNLIFVPSIFSGLEKTGIYTTGFQQVSFPSHPKFDSMKTCLLRWLFLNFNLNKTRTKT